MSIAIIVHGGAGTVAPERFDVVQAGCREAALVGWRILQAGGSAMDAVEATVRVLEDNPNYNAGIGSCLTADGTIEMDAGIMDGDALRMGAVAGVERIKNPISLARRVLASSHALLIGRGAQQFALANGIALCRREDLLTERQYSNWKQLRDEGLVHKDEEEPRFHRIEIGKVGAASSKDEQATDEPSFHRYEIASIPARDEAAKEQPKTHEPEDKHGTVGAVAVDSRGRLAAATSTGGIPNKYPGRVGDSPLVGCGFYADENAAVSCTGHGEDFIRLTIAKRAADNVAHGMSARDAAEATIATLGAKAAGTGGLIVVDRLGNVGFAWNSTHLAHAFIANNMQEPIVGV
jgi:beta-aspartyl-peptidase (threonine type)